MLVPDVTNVLGRLLANPYAALLALYALAYTPILVMRGIYWDSWVWYRQFIYHDYARIFAEEFDTTMVPHFYWLFRFVDLFRDPVFVERLIIFLSWPLAGLLLFYILHRFFEWDFKNAFLLCAYYLLYPVYIVRFDLMIGYHSFANACFFIGATLLFIALFRKRWGFAFELLALPFFFLAFLVNSYPFLFGVVLLAHIYLFAQREKTVFKATFSTIKTLTISWLRRYFYILAVPIVFVLWRLLMFAPYGKDAEYNKILIFEPSFGLITRILEDLWGGLYAGLLWPLFAALTLTERKFFVLGTLIACVALWYISRQYLEDRPVPRMSPITSLIIGCFIAVVALAPYLIVGKTPHIYGNGFGLRHGLLLGLPAALLLTGIVGFLVREWLQRYVHIGILGLSIGFLWFNFFLLDMDWYKQQSVLHDFPAILEKIPRGSIIVVSDSAASYNWNKRGIGRPEYNGWLDTLAGQKQYFGVGKSNYAQDPNAMELAATSTINVTIRSLRPLSEPVMKEWVHLR
jgi:hypothetical protein